MRGIVGGMGVGLFKYVFVNLIDIVVSFLEGEEVFLEVLKERCVLNFFGCDWKLLLKIFVDGELDFKVKIKVGVIFVVVKEKLDSFGCECEILLKKKKWVFV